MDSRKIYSGYIKEFRWFYIDLNDHVIHILNQIRIFAWDRIVGVLKYIYC